MILLLEFTIDNLIGRKQPQRAKKKITKNNILSHHALQSLFLKKAFLRKLKLCQSSRFPLLGLGPRYFFNHYPGHWIPHSASITQMLATTLSYPQFHSLTWPMMPQIRVPGWPVVVNNSQLSLVNCIHFQWTWNTSGYTYYYHRLSCFPGMRLWALN